MRFDRNLRWAGMAAMLLAVPLGLWMAKLDAVAPATVALLVALLGFQFWAQGIKGYRRARKPSRRDLARDRVIVRGFYLFLIALQISKGVTGVYEWPHAIAYALFFLALSCGNEWYFHQRVAKA